MDVKEEKAQDSSQEQDVKEVKAEESSPEGEVFEGENRNIPYSRFKEKAAEAKELKKQIDKLMADKDEAVRKTAQQYQTYYESEIAKLQRTQQQDPYYEPEEETNKLSPLLEEINMLKSSLSEFKVERENERILSQVKTLKSVYPELEEEHVLVVKKTKPNWSIEECAEYSHKYFEDKVKGKFSTMMAKKKEAAKKPIMGADGKLNIEPNERPKTFQDAKKRMMEYAQMLDRR